MPSQPAMKLDSLRIFYQLSPLRCCAYLGRGREAHLLREGARPWRDETGVLEGDPNWYARIESELHAADLLVAIIGTDSEVCRWQTRELLAADRRGKPIVALRVDDRAPMPLSFARSSRSKPGQTGPRRSRFWSKPCSEPPRHCPQHQHKQLRKRRIPDQRAAEIVCSKACSTAISLPGPIFTCHWKASNVVRPMPSDR
jgi:hypothetical protein